MSSESLSDRRRVDGGVPTPWDLARAAADHILAHGTSYDDLAQGPLGEALTADELRNLADDGAALLALVNDMRGMADDCERRAKHHQLTVERYGRIGR